MSYDGCAPLGFYQNKMCEVILNKSLQDLSDEQKTHLDRIKKSWIVIPYLIYVNSSNNQIISIEEWMSGDDVHSKSDYDVKQKELEEVFNKIMTKTGGLDDTSGIGPNMQNFDSSNISAEQMQQAQDMFKTMTPEQQEAMMKQVRASGGMGGTNDVDSASGGMGGTNDIDSASGLPNMEDILQGIGGISK